MSTNMYNSTTQVSVDGIVGLNNESQLRSRYKDFGQEHVFQFFNELEPGQKRRFLEQLELIDLEQVKNLFEKYQQSTNLELNELKLEEPRGFKLNGAQNEFTKSQAISAGGEALEAGRFGVVIVAGGQGTRLGFAHPKGMYPIAPLSNATLFEILFKKIQNVAATYGTSIPVYLMTSPATHQETVDFLRDHQRFGLAADDLFVFCQGTMPAVDLENGKLFLASKGSLFASPDGHGGMVAAMKTSGAFENMVARTVDQLFYMQIDNPLVEVLSPEAIGYHLLSRSQATTMVIRKTDPLEKVGNVAMVDSKMQIVEYSDLPDHVAKATASNGDLKYWAGNVAVHVWDIDFLMDTAESNTGLPHHFALKKVPHVDANGHVQKPVEPNGIKFEQFIFDLLPAADRSIVVEVERDSYFAPLKNPVGTPTDSPEYVQKKLLNLHRRWLEASGAVINEGVAVEISPSFAVNASQVAKQIDEGRIFSEDQILD